MNQTKELCFNSSFELKGDAAEGQFTGYAAVFGNIDLQDDIIAPGAFADSLRERTPAMLLHHQRDKPCGVWTSIGEDSKGLRVTGQLAIKTQAGAEARELMRLGALSGLSVGMRVTGDAFDRQSGVRTIVKANLYEISIVTMPANQSARVASVKGFTKPQTIRDFEDQLRRIGYSVREARALASKGWQGLSVREERSTELQDVAALLREAASKLR